MILLCAYDIIDNFDFLYFFSRLLLTGMCNLVA